jgi:phage baseplate assembly protein W
MQLAYPYQLDGAGRTATAAQEQHVRDLIEQVLFTSPGERVNQPTFGSGLAGLLFGSSGDIVQAATEHIVRAALQQWLGDLIQVQGVDVDVEDSALSVTVRYVLLLSQQAQVAQFSTASTGG